MTKEELSELIKESAEKKGIDAGPAYKQGFVDGAGLALDKIQGIIDKEPDRGSVTLRDFADWLSQRIAFDYLTVHYEDGACIMCLWVGSCPPAFADGVWWHCDRATYVTEISDHCLLHNLDLSEYKDKEGMVDYGKCIIKCR